MTSCMEFRLRRGLAASARRPATEGSLGFFLTSSSFSSGLGDEASSALGEESSCLGFCASGVVVVVGSGVKSSTNVCGGRVII